MGREPARGFWPGGLCSRIAPNVTKGKPVVSLSLCHLDPICPRRLVPEPEGGPPRPIHTPGSQQVSCAKEGRGLCAGLPRQDKAPQRTPHTQPPRVRGHKCAMTPGCLCGGQPGASSPPLRGTQGLHWLQVVQGAAQVSPGHLHLHRAGGWFRNSSRKCCPDLTVRHPCHPSHSLDPGLRPESETLTRLIH